MELTILSFILGIPAALVAVKKLLERKKMTSSDHSVVRRGIVTDFKIPRKIKIGSWSEVSAVYEGSVSSGFFSLKITDCEGTPQWFGDNESVEGRHLNSGDYIETGKLNFTDGRYEGSWKFRPDPPLKKGKGKAEVGMFEDKDFVDGNGNAIPHRPYIDLQEREIILY